MEPGAEQKSVCSNLSALFPNLTRFIGSLFTNPPDPQPPTSSPDSSTDTKEQHEIVIGMPAADSSTEGLGMHLGLAVDGTGVDNHEESSNSWAHNNPVAQLVRELQLGKTLLSFVVPLTTGVLAVYARDPPSLPAFQVTSLFLCVGLCFVWNGILLPGLLPRAAYVMEQLGVASIFFAFFYVVGSFLPLNLGWLAWTSFAITILPSLISCIPT